MPSSATRHEVLTECHARSRFHALKYQDCFDDIVFVSKWHEWNKDEALIESHFTAQLILFKSDYNTFREFPQCICDISMS